MLGIPNTDQDQLHQWSNVSSCILDYPTLKEYEVFSEVIENFQEYLRHLIAEREKNPL